MKKFVFAIGVATGAGVVSLLIAGTLTRLVGVEPENSILLFPWIGSILLLLVVGLPVLHRIASRWLRIEPLSGRVVVLLPITVGVGVVAFAAGICISPLVGMILLD